MKNIIISIILISGMLVPGISQANYFRVNTNIDAYDVNPGDGGCDIDEDTAGSQCSLRAAIQEANLWWGKDTIDFYIPWPMIPRIVLKTPMLEITDPVIINATGHPPGYPGVPAVELDGNGTEGGLVVSCGDTEISGLLIRGADTCIILKDKGGNVIEQNYLGVELDGKTASLNCNTGIQIIDSPNNIIGGTDPLDRNVISGISPYGILIQGEASINNLIQGNIIGPDSTGTSPLLNPPTGYTIGISIMGPASQNIIGGAEPSAGNLISNNMYGIIIQKSVIGVTWGNTIIGNLIGTDKTGLDPLPNETGLFIGNSHDNIIGGSEVGTGNIISGNISNGVSIMGTGSENNIIKGNYIGTDINGMEALPNWNAGIQIWEGGNQVGGSDPDDRNVISGNGGPGVYIIGESATGNQVKGNIIGVDHTGINAVPNEWGLVIENGNGNTIGGSDPLDGNTIAYNLSGGVAVKDGMLSATHFGSNPAEAYDLGISNAILSNRIYANDGLGIDLIKTIDVPSETHPMGLGPDLNDSLDEDEGPNNLQNFPEIISFENGEIHGSIHTTPFSEVLIQCFSNDVCDSSGYGEGKTWIGQTNVITDSQGNADFMITPGILPIPGIGLSTTATVENSTSEFSLCFDISGQVPDCDLDQDQDVDGSDIIILISEFGRQDCTIQNPCSSDLDDNGRVDQEDLRLFAQQYGDMDRDGA